MTMTLIESKTLGAAAASIEFTSIPQDGTDLVVLLNLRGNDASTVSDSLIQFNGDTGANYAWRRLTGGGDFVGTDSGNGFLSGSIPGATATSNTFGNATVYIPNYTSTVAKSGSVDGVSEHNAVRSYQVIIACSWTGTVAITSLLIKLFSGANILSGSTASLYKVTKGSDGIVTTS
jgi:hypothetical protein